MQTETGVDTVECLEDTFRQLSYASMQFFANLVIVRLLQLFCEHHHFGAYFTLSVASCFLIAGYGTGLQNFMRDQARNKIPYNLVLETLKVI